MPRSNGLNEYDEIRYSSYCFGFDRFARLTGRQLALDKLGANTCAKYRWLGVIYLDQVQEFRQSSS